MKQADQDQLEQTTRDAFLATPEKHRTSIFKKAPIGSPTTRALIRAAHIPPSFQPARIAHWLTSEHQHKLEELVLSPEHEPWFRTLLQHFFVRVHNPMNDLLLRLIDPKAQAPQTFEQALDSVAKQFPQDPYLSLYTAATRWVCHDQMEADNALEGTSGHFPELDKELQAVSDTVARLYDINPAAVTDAVNALQRAQALTSSLAAELKSLATEANEPEPDWSSREDFLAHRTRMVDLASSRSRMLERAAALVETLINLLAAATVRHRLPSRSVALTNLAHTAATELTQHADDLKPIVMNHSGSATEWLKWLWQQEGVEAENLQQKLRPISAALADLLADASWPDLEWPEPAPASTPAPKPPLSAVPQAPPEPLAQPVAPAPQPDPIPSTATAAPVTTAEKDKASVTPPNPEQPASFPPSQKPAPVPAAPQPQPAATHPVSLKPATVETPNAPEQKTLPSVTAPIAEPAPALAPAEDRSPIAADVWRLASAKRWGLASHLAALCSPAELPPPWLFEAAAIAPRINYEVSPLSERLTELFTHSADFRVDPLHQEVRPVARLLLAAVALKPALLAPKTGAASLLKLSELAAVPKLLAVGQLVEAVAEFGLHRQALSPEMLRAPHNVADWERQLALVRAEIHQWLEQAPLRGFNYAIAARIWRKWTTHNGPIRHLLQETANAGPRQVEALRKQWHPWTWHAAEFVQSGIREFNHRKTMDGTARDKLIERIGEAAHLAERVFVLLSQTPQPVGTFRDEQVHLLLAARQRHLGSARHELNTLIASSRDDASTAAARLCDESLEQLNDLLQGHLPLPGGDEPKPRWILDAELLRDPVFRLAHDGTVITPTSSQREALLVLARTAPNWNAAWARQIASENHLGTAALLEFFRWQQPPGLDVPELERQRDAALQTCRSKAEARIADTRRLLDELVRLGLCRTSDYDAWSADLNGIEELLPATVDLPPLYQRLGAVREKLQQQRDNEAANLRRRLEAIPAVPQPARDCILSLLAEGDIHTATDYLDLVSNGQPLPQPGTPPSIFLAFFGKDAWLQHAQELLHDHIPTECHQAARDGTPWNRLDFSLLGPDQQSTAASHLHLWATLEGQRQAAEPDALKLASALGLQPLKAVARPTRNAPVVLRSFSLQAQPLNERASAVVPAFGSGANGRYTLHLVWGQPSPEELLTLCRRETGDTSGHIVATFRLLSTKDRRELAEEARKPERSFKGVVVDRGLFTFACAQASARFPTILRCALPFSCVEPFSVAAGEVPPEMFYGRDRELHALEDPRGSCFLYGGRQLGKTALLRSLERRFHNLPQGRAAVFVDLKRELISRGRGIDALWSVLINRLQDAGVLSDRVGASAGQEALFRHIQDWLDASPDRRLLLLLDEADAFLDQDSRPTEGYEPFSRCQRLKGLMEDTGHRFKVILAGLHNVQRTTRSANHPLAHFGEAICIGPMLEEAESREARALVEQPLAAAGYQFHSPEVVSRILALTNYYPSLIQIFCHHLLADLRANHVTRFPSPRSTPPCVITSQHIQTVYGTRGRKAIDDALGYTLDLDKRYKLIARLVAFYHANQPGLDGVALRDLRADASEYWPAGFSDMRTDDEFRALLDEMVGLGILRQLQNTTRFALRNQNVITLLGNADEIARQLDEAKSWEPPIKYEADKFRRLISERPRLIFSPLTSQGENELKATENRVTLLYGLPIAGMADVPLAMASDSMFGKSRTLTVRDLREASALSDAIGRTARPPQSHTILLVAPELPWDETWVAAAQNRIGTFTSKDAFITILFIADPRKTAATLRGLEGATENGVRGLTLRPWHDVAVRQWLDELGIGEDRKLWDRIRQATGNWPGLLMRLNTANAVTLLQACDELEKALQDPAQVSDLLPAFGFHVDFAKEPLRVAAQLGQFTIQEVCELSDATDDQARERIADCITWAERLGLISMAGSKLELDPIASKILIQMV